MSYWVGVTSAPGIMTSRPELQVDTGDGVPVDVPLSRGEAALGVVPLSPGRPH